ncbi:MAG: trypsin-like peptidase domain-containing protein [Eubacteriales bacterium]
MSDRLKIDSAEGYKSETNGKGRDSNPDKRCFPFICDKKTDCGCKEATYGGFQYRWHYDDYQRSLAARRQRENRAGLRVFSIVVTIVFFICFMTLGIVLIVNYAAGTKTEASSAAVPNPETEGARFDDANAVIPVIGVSGEETPAGGMTIPEIVASAKPSVVGITVDTGMSRVVATGIIITEDGYIVTNCHVVEDEGDYRIYLYDGSEYTAEVIGMDELTDLAVLKIAADGLVAAELGDSDLLVEGETVVAIGTPAGITFAGTSTDGIVSAINRDIPIYDDDGVAVKTMTVIQTSATINPGNSGGPLLNGRGQVVGITTMKLSSYEGIGFALPITGAIPIINELIANGEVTERPDGTFAYKRARIGITCQSVDEDTSELYRIPRGVVVVYVDPDADVYDAGLREGDIIVTFNGADIIDINDIDTQLSKLRPGDVSSAHIYRSGRYYDIEFTLGSFA